MEFLLEFLLGSIEFLGYIGIMLIVGLEYACFPLPSEIVLPTIGILSTKGVYNVWFALAYSVVGGLLGCMICYAIGYFGGDKLIKIINFKYKSTVKSTQALNKWFEKYGNVAVFFSRLLPLTRTYVSFLAGAMKMNLKEFIFYSLGGIVLWNTILILVGYFVGDNWALIKDILTRYTNIAAVMAVIVLVAVVYLKRKKKK